MNVAFFVWLVALWTLLWGAPTLANVVSGVIVAALALLVVPRPAPVAEAEPPVIRPIALASLSVWFAWKLVESNVAVAREVLRPTSRTRIRTGIVAVELPGCSPGIATVVANAITLTPGTLTVELDPAAPTLYVHVMQLTTPDQVRADVREIERRVTAAVGSRAQRAVVAGRSEP